MNKVLALTLLALLLAGCDDTSQTINTRHKAPLVTAPAELISLSTAMLGPPNVRHMWQFKIQSMAPENKLVKKGDVVLTFDGDQLRNRLIGRSSDLKAEIKNAENQRLNDEAKQHDLVLALAEAQMNYEKAKRKAQITDESTSKIDRDKQQADYRLYSEKLALAKQQLAHQKKAMVLNAKVSQGKIRTIRSRVNSINKDLQKLTVRAPKDGLVMYYNWNGEKPTVGQTVYMGQILISLPSLNKVALKAEFDEPDTAKLHKGQQVKVTFDAYPELAYMGKIAHLGRSYHAKSTNNPKVVFDALIELTGKHPDVMRPGMQAKVEVL